MALLAASLLTIGTTALAHVDPPGCFQTGPAIIVSVFQHTNAACSTAADCSPAFPPGTPCLNSTCSPGLVGNVSECENIRYRATLQKADPNDDTICAFSGGTFKMTTPDGVVHDINLDVPCIGGNTGLEGCLDSVNSLVSDIIDYTVKPADVVGGLITATAQYTGGSVHDSANNTSGVSATTPKSTPVTSCNDNNNCTTDTCDPNVHGSAACTNTPVVCDDNSLCTTDVCNPANGQCVFTPINCNDNNNCTNDSCNPATGCVNTPIVCNDNNACTADSCNPANGQCVFTPNVVCNDNNACTDDSCNPANGQCVFTPNIVCNDNNTCTDDSCNPSTGQCEFVDNGTCHPAICRTPGFWKTHGAISDEVIDLGGGSLSVCGQCINTAAATSVGDAASVLEAMCIPVRGEPRLQLVRQLTALELNCIISGFGADCSGDPSNTGSLYNTCNAACINNTALVNDCIAAIDCFNNGGLFDENTGLCGSDPNGSCHERALPNTIAQQPADTPQACNAAAKNTCTVILAGQANCAKDSCP